jgi:hypothetical protein
MWWRFVWTTEDGESHVLQQTEAALPDRKLFGDDPSRAREATFIFGSGARVTVDKNGGDDVVFAAAVRIDSVELGEPA